MEIILTGMNSGDMHMIRVFFLYLSENSNFLLPFIYIYLEIILNLIVFIFDYAGKL